MSIHLSGPALHPVEPIEGPDHEALQQAQAKAHQDHTQHRRSDAGSSPRRSPVAGGLTLPHKLKVLQVSLKLQGSALAVVRAKAQVLRGALPEKGQRRGALAKSAVRGAGGLGVLALLIDESEDDPEQKEELQELYKDLRREARQARQQGLVVPGLAVAPGASGPGSAHELIGLPKERQNVIGVMEYWLGKTPDGSLQGLVDQLNALAARLGQPLAPPERKTALRLLNLHRYVLALVEMATSFLRAAGASNNSGPKDVVAVLRRVVSLMPQSMPLNGTYELLAERADRQLSLQIHLANQLLGFVRSLPVHMWSNTNMRDEALKNLRELQSRLAGVEENLTIERYTL